MKLKIRLKNPKQLEDMGQSLIDDIAENLIAEARDNLVKNHSINTGHLRANSRIIRGHLKNAVVFNEEYACLIGGRQGIITDSRTSSENISELRNRVLSKDGRYHEAKSFITGSFFDKPLGIKLKCKKGRGYLKVTSDHLILCSRAGIPVWERADSIRIGDLVWHRRKKAHNKGVLVSERIKKTCAYCNSKFEITKNKDTIRRVSYCSQKCYHKYTYHDRAKGKNWKLSMKQRERKSAENNPSWKGGISKMPYGPEWNKILKEKIKIRDNFSCIYCGKKEEEWPFHVHHVNGNKFDNEMINLVTVCPSCHAKQQWRDCELVDVNTDIFEEVPIIFAERIEKNGKSLKKTKLWDISVQNENSFCAGGMLIHNSAVEYGTGAHEVSIEGRESIKNWVIKKLRKSGSEAEEIANRIIWSIHWNGTQPHPFLRPAVDAIKLKYPKVAVKIGG